MQIEETLINDRLRVTYLEDFAFQLFVIVQQIFKK